jgi:hypothetical protein
LLSLEGGNVVTTIEFITKKLNKAKVAWEVQSKKPNVTPSEIENLAEKVKHYQIVLDLLLKNSKD